MAAVQDTPFALSSGQVFASGLVEECVPLAAVLGKCLVALGGAPGALGWGAEPDSDLPAFSCMYHYDHVGRQLGVLQPLPEL